ncbi:S41 family peptidase [Bacteroidota bacterium]
MKIILFILCFGPFLNLHANIQTNLKIDTLSREERILGLSMVYCEAKYNFQYWDQVPDLDWDQLFQDFLPLVEKAQDKLEYVNVLKQYVALLHDGHTFVTYPRDVFQQFDSPPVTVMEISGKAVITDFSPPEEMDGVIIEKYSEILSVDGIPVESYINDKVYPFICTGTDHYLKYRGCIELLFGEKNSIVELEIEQPDGQRRNIRLRRNLTEIPIEKQPVVFMELPGFPWKLETVEHRELGAGMHYIAINTMADSDLPNKFDKVINSVASLKGLIIDLRLNHGGNSANGDKVIQRLIQHKIPTIKRKTLAYRSSERAWKNEVFGQNWFNYEQGYLEPRGSFQFNGPIVVLTSPNTWSASENFLAPLVTDKRITIVGQPTGGSTGQPLFIPLVGGAYFGICSVRNEFVDGQEFVGFGIQPDVYIEPDLFELRKGRDNILLKAIEILDSLVN